MRCSYSSAIAVCLNLSTELKSVKHVRNMIEKIFWHGFKLPETYALWPPVTVPSKVAKTVVYMILAGVFN